MSDNVNFNIINKAWSKMIKDREIEITKKYPSFKNLREIYLKNNEDDHNYITLSFINISKAVDSDIDVPMLKRFIINWLKKFSNDVKIMRTENKELLLKVSKKLKFSL